MSPDNAITALVAAVTSLGSAYLGAAVVWRSQTRAFQRRERAIANALLQDLDRIEREVPDIRQDDWRRLYQEPKVIGIHPWITPLIVELAGRDAPIVGMFMQLEPLLRRHSNVTNETSSAQLDLERLRREVADRQQLVDDPQRQGARTANQEQLRMVAERLPDGEAKFATQLLKWDLVTTDLTRHIAALRTRVGAITAAPVLEQLSLLHWGED